MWYSSHFFNTILVLEALARLNLLLAVEEVVRGSLALGRFLRFLTQLGVNLHARRSYAQ